MNPHRFTIPFEQERLARAGGAVVLNAPDLRDMDMLAENLTFEQDDAEIYARLQAQGANVEPRVETGAFDRAVVILSKHSDFNKAMIGRAWQLVKDGGDILVEGAKTEGIDSLIRAIRSIGLAPEVEPKYHGKIAWFERQHARVGDIQSWIDLDKPYENADGFLVRPGIFSSKSTDKGTAFLLENLNFPIKGVVADLGGGYGAISKALLAKNDEIEALDLYEISHLASECAKANVRDARAHIHWLEANKAAREYYNVIVSNPPFHQGRAGDPNIGMGFIDAAARSLRARGNFYMVANRHLPYENRLKARFGHVEVMAENNAYKIFKATRPQGKNV